jgi:hypothetical protein
LVTRKKITIDLKFNGTGKIGNPQPGCFIGGVPNPKIFDDLHFSMYRQEMDENGIWSPVLDEDSVEGCFQINISATSKGYRELGKYFLSLAEIDSRKDKNYHEHVDDISSLDNRTKIDFVFRKTASNGNNKMTTIKKEKTIKNK